MNRWNTRRIDQLGKVVTGKTPPSERPEEFGSQFPFITPSDIPGTQKYIITERFLSEKGMESFRRMQLPRKSVCVVCIGATIGKVCQVTTPSVANQQINSIVPTPGETDADFAYYLATTLKDSLVSFAGGSATPIINKSAFSSIKVLVPEYDTQRKIAAVLAGYDDLIEANRRRIALLERMAEELYREWFVRLRFPGHAKTKITKGLPAGWEIRPFSAVVTIDPIERIDKQEERPFAPMDDLSESSMYFTPSERRKGNIGPKFRNGDVLFPRITPSVENGKRGLVLTLADGEVAQGSTEFIVMREKVITSEHIYFLSCSEGFRTNAELSMTGASGRQRVQDQCFDNFLVKLPPEPLRERFTEVVRPMVTQIRILSQQSEHLQRTRDLLLPRLISGKLSVEALPIAFPPSMADPGP